VARIVVVGAGIGGLGVALCAGRLGHEVVLVERDETPLPADARAAFGWDRRGAPQVRHSHAFLARLRNLLRDRHPDVLDALHGAGATSLDFISMLPEGMDRTPLPGDDDLVAIACRRTTFEWVLRRLVLADGVASLLHGRRVDALSTSGEGPIPRVTGVRLDDGSSLEADLVVMAGGRRADVPALLESHGVTIPEEVEDTGIVYYSRFFTLRDGADHPPHLGPIGGDLDHLKYGVFPGDNRTFSVTLATYSADDQLRRRLLDPDAFLRIAAAIPATAAHVEPERSEPDTGVHVMAGLVNRRRWFSQDDGAPRVLGLHAVGDAHTCTNPLYGRGCSLAMVQAQLLADALEAHGTDHEARARAYETDSDGEVTPWYRAAVAQDRLNRRTERRSGDEGDPAPGSATSGDATAAVDPGDFARELLRDGLFPALRIDPVVLRAFLRMMNLLSPPDTLMADPDLIGRVMQVYAGRHDRPVEPPLGPSRSELLEL
jgi:2-polyprenyl-6-methoxyphenol hydroxylase-like FAD-dependent oxidoreductase